MKILKYFLLLIFAAASLNAQKFIHKSGSVRNLSEEFERVYNANSEKDNYWIGYSLPNESNYDVAVGTFYFNREGSYGLDDLLNGKINFEKYLSLGGNKNGYSISGTSINLTNVRISEKDERIGKTAILIRYDRNSRSVNDFAEIVVCDLSYYANLYGYELNWLGSADKQMSAEYLMSRYRASDNWYIKEELVPAAGVHFGVEGLTEFLIEVFNTNEAEDVKEDVLFWIGMQGSSQAFSFLKNIVYEESSELAEHAVTGISYIQTEDALDELIYIARNHPDGEVREHAIYGLSRKAVKRAEETLKDVVENDPDIEIKKSAIYALANDGSKQVDYLIDVAKNHESLILRKTAIYSLSNIEEDERVLKALISLAKGE